MLKMRYFLKTNRQALGAPLSDPRNLTHTNCTATKRSNVVAHKKSILNSKIWGDFSALSLFVILPLHFTWSDDGTDRIHSRERKNGRFCGCKILILSKASQFYLTKSARGCGCISIASTVLVESIIQINKTYKCAFLSIKILLKLKLPGLRLGPRWGSFQRSPKPPS